jgi:hypothetical protein
MVRKLKVQNFITREIWSEYNERKGTRNKKQTTERSVCITREETHRVNKEIRDKFILAGYLRHPKL